MKSSAFMSVLVLLLLPATASSQSYEWIQRIESVPGPSPDPYEELYTLLEQVAATEFGVYSVGRSDCSVLCYGFIAKYRAADGKLEWKRKISIFDETEAFTLAVNELGVFVAGRFHHLGHSDSYVRLYDHDGNTVWTVRDERRADELWEIVLDEDSLYVIGSKGGIDQSAVVRRLAFDGTVLWNRKFSGKTDGGYLLQLADGRLYAKTGNDRVFVIRAEDGALLDHFQVGPMFGQLDMLYADGFIYVFDPYMAIKYGLDGTEIWRLEFRDATPVLSDLSAVAVVDGGLLLSMLYGQPPFSPRPPEPIRNGSVLVRLDFDGNLHPVAEFPDHNTDVRSLTVFDGATYATGQALAYRAVNYYVFDGYTARFSDKDLMRPSILSLAGATPAMPPRLAVLRHDYGSGPVLVAVLDAAPGSVQYLVEFSDGLKPVGFGQVADINGNGYEELVVVSRLPAVAEVRDSFDGSLVSTVKLGDDFAPIAATIEQRPGTAPRLAVAARNKAKDTSLVRVHNLKNGNLLASNAYHAGFDAVDVAALPDTSGGGARRYALLGRNRVAGDPHKIELRGGNGELLDNIWLGNELEPLQLSVAGPGVDGLTVLRYAAWNGILDVQRIDLASGDRLTARYSGNLTPVTMLELPDIDGSGYPEYSVYGEETGGESVKAETRDVATGALEHNVFSGKYYRPQDAVYVGNVPGFGDNAFALLGYRYAQREFRATLADGGGTKLFELEFLIDR